MSKFLILLGFFLMMINIPSTFGSATEEFNDLKQKWEKTSKTVNTLKVGDACTEDADKKYETAEAQLKLDQVALDDAAEEGARQNIVNALTPLINDVDETKPVCFKPGSRCNKMKCVVGVGGADDSGSDASNSTQNSTECEEVKGGDYSIFRPNCFKGAIAKWPESSAVTLRSRIIPVILAIVSPALVFASKAFL